MYTRLATLSKQDKHMRTIHTICLCLTILALPGCRGCKEQRARLESATSSQSPQPTKSLAASRLDFHGLNLARAPRTNRPGDLPDLWLELPKGSGLFEIRRNVKCVYNKPDGTVYYNSWKNHFYIQHDPIGDGTLTYYGPFKGDPTEVLNLDNEATTDATPGTNT